MINLWMKSYLNEIFDMQVLNVFHHFQSIEFVLQFFHIHSMQLISVYQHDVDQKFERIFVSH